MNERRDDTTKPEAESRPAPPEGSYYYDDATGYEPYTPEDEEEEDADAEAEREGAERPAEGTGGGA